MNSCFALFGVSLLLGQVSAQAADNWGNYYETNGAVGNLVTLTFTGMDQATKGQLVTFDYKVVSGQIYHIHATCSQAHYAVNPAYRTIKCISAPEASHPKDKIFISGNITRDVCISFLYTPPAVATDKGLDYWKGSLFCPSYSY